jgi:2-amino-4-hydroxy-6-hydroxymethyldihydropteridine diphosphokinase
LYDYYLALGSNLGDPQENLQGALKALAHGTQIEADSGFFHSRAWGVEDQPDFLNAVVHALDPRPPEELLAWLQEIEQAFGRQRVKKWGPRTLDLDILCCGKLEVSSEILTLPHPGFFLRAFVLAPLLEIAPDFLHPVTGCSAQAAWEALPNKDREGVFPLETGPKETATG